jgi:hypothetical protein
MSKKNIAQEDAKAQGRFRLQINEEGKVVGDSGWRKNQITNLGFNQYLVDNLAHLAGSKYIAYAALGTGTAPASNATSLNGELTENANLRMAVTPSSVGSNTARFAFTLSSGVFTAATGYPISNVGLFDASVTAAGTIFAGNTFASSSLASNQVVQATYDISFA